MSNFDSAMGRSSLVSLIFYSPCFPMEPATCRVETHQGAHQRPISSMPNARLANSSFGTAAGSFLISKWVLDAFSMFMGGKEHQTPMSTLKPKFNRLSSLFFRTVLRDCDSPEPCKYLLTGCQDSTKPSLSKVAQFLSL